ncbi:MAG: protein kinase, partial [Candidatus Wallbacteria bacterium]|nr:protein kinase [Candidatus Wallbacteria bacterium]
MAGKRQLKPSVVSAARPAEGAVANGDAKPPALPPGLLASYRAEELIGAGAMGVVWRATHLGLQRPAAIKLPTLTDPSYVERFVREGRLLSRLRHPNLVRVYDAGAVDGCPYLVMEFVRGCTLAGLARGRALPPEVAVALVSQLLEGLGHAHAGGVLHRDVKSDNALVTREGVVKLADFGLARADFEPGRTQVGMLMGTPAYMSPEQAGGVALDARSDLYSVAVVLFELVAGRLPFVSDNPLELLRRQMKEAPPMLAQVASGVPQELADAVMRGLAKDPAERFGSAGEFAAALRETVSEQRLERAMARLPGLVASAGASAQVVAGTTAASPAVVTRRAPGREAPDRTVAASPARKREDGRATARPGSDEPRRWRGRALTFFALVLAAAFWAGSRAPRPVTPAAPDVPAIQSRPAGARTTQAAPPPKLEFLRKNSVGYEEYRNEKDGSELIS